MMKIIKQFDNFQNEQEVEKVMDDIDDLKKELEQGGKKVNSNQLALDVLDKLLDKGFDVEKVDKETITENNFYPLNESSETVETAIHTIENLELGHNLCEKFPKAKVWLPKVLEWVKKILSLPFTLLKKLASWISRACGARFETSETVGLVSLGALALVGLIYGIIHFPGFTAIVAGGFSIWTLMKLMGAIVKGISSIYTLFKKWFKISKEVGNKKMSTNDLLDVIEPDYKKKFNKKIPFTFKTQLDDWYHHHESEHVQEFINNITKRIIRIKQVQNPKWTKTQFRDLFGKIEKKVKDKNVILIFRNLFEIYL